MFPDGFLQFLVQEVLKFIKKHGSYSPKSSGTFLWNSVIYHPLMFFSALALPVWQYKRGALPIKILCQLLPTVSYISRNKLLSALPWQDMKWDQLNKN